MTERGNSDSLYIILYGALLKNTYGIPMNAHFLPATPLKGGISTIKNRYLPSTSRPSLQRSSLTPQPVSGLSVFGDCHVHPHLHLKNTEPEGSSVDALGINFNGRIWSLASKQKKYLEVEDF